jgi:hypothetical protein
MDKSKADALTKGLVCYQALWTLLQTVTRKVEGFTVTLLELHTLARIGSTLLLYLVWWNKPQDVLVPEVVGVDAPIAAFMSSTKFRAMFRVQNGICQPETVVNGPEGEAFDKQDGTDGEVGVLTLQESPASS